MTSKPEILAPAGNMACLKAALEEGADAVYFGLKNLNARIGAENFHHEKLEEVVALIHERGAKAYLTLNIDLCERETGQAVRTLDFAEKCGVDAVLVKDPALLLFAKFFPELEFHFSTQAGVCNSAGVRMAKELGIKRVVIARELSNNEITACTRIDGIETEIFVQGALCFCASGRCLMSSWGGGRSGNRGTCTSPCRVEWKFNGKSLNTPFSMQDLSLIAKLEKIVESGVKCLKIEGRLKNEAWVRRAVALYREALDKGMDDNIRQEIISLGDYSGRKMSSGYFDGEREFMTAVSARPSLNNSKKNIQSSGEDREKEQSDENSDKYYDFECDTFGNKIAIKIIVSGQETEFEIKKTLVKNKARAMTLADLADWLGQCRIQNYALGSFEIDDPDFLIPRKSANAVADRISGIIHKAKKKKPDVIRLDLSDEIKSVLAGKACEGEVNNIPLCEKINAARIDCRDYEGFSKSVNVENIIIENIADAGQLKQFSAKSGENIIISLPPVFYENNVNRFRSVIMGCKEMGLKVEVNDWAGLWLGREAKVGFAAGPGLAVLNSLAALKLKELGAEFVKVSLEADRKKLEDFSFTVSVPYSLTVFSRPALMYSRAGLSWDIKYKETIEDNRDIRVRAYNRGDLCEIRPEKPYDLTGVKNNRIRAAYLEADLVVSENPVEEWYELSANMHGGGRKKSFTFNYNGTLF